MARTQHDRRSRSLTLLIVPHSTQHPITIHLPTWIFPLFLLLGIVVLSGLTVLTVRHYVYVKQLEARLQEQTQYYETERAREQELRRTILTQHDQVLNLRSQFDSLYGEVEAFQSGLTAEVEEFRARLAEVDRLTEQLRLIVGLEATPTPTAEPGAWRAGGPNALASVESTGRGSGNLNLRVAFAPSSLNLESDPGVEHLRTLEASLPAKMTELYQLKEQIEARVALVDQDKRSSPTEIERQLQLVDAAPKGWPAVGSITSEFGAREFLGRDDFHTGVDIGVWYRTQVRATQDGIVVAAGWQRGYGWTVEIQHEMGFSTLYAHLSRYLVEVGDEVKAGDIIALSGGSGNSTGPHLHYEIRLNGVPVDPTKYLSMKP